MVDITVGIYQVLEPLIIITRLAGFCPITCQRNGPAYTCHLSIKYCVYSYILGTLLMLNAAWGLTIDLDHNSSIRMRNSTVKYVTLVDLGEIVFTVFVGVMSTPFRIKYLLRALDAFVKFDQVLPLKSPRKERFLGIFVMSSLLLFALFVLIYETTLWGGISTQRNVLSAWFVRYFSLYVMYFFVIVQQLPYWGLVRCIEKRLKTFNMALEYFKLNSGSKLAINWLNFHQTRTSKKILSNVNFLSLDRISQLMKLYDLIGDSTEATNSFCSVSMMLILLSCLLHLVVTPYFFLIELANNGIGYFIFLQLVWTGLHTARLLVIVEASQACLDENQKTSDLICNLLTCELPQDVKSQLKLLAIQLTCRKMKFTAFSLLKINRALLTTMSGTVATFLVILSQYGKVGSDTYFSGN